MNVRWIALMLGILGLAMTGQLLLADSGFTRTQELRAAVARQRVENQTLVERNRALEAEVINLKNGRAAAEERARTDLGMIGQSETFFQVVPPGNGDKFVARANKD